MRGGANSGSGRTAPLKGTGPNHEKAGAKPDYLRRVIIGFARIRRPWVVLWLRHSTVIIM
jgi:hypothetical protein